MITPAEPHPNPSPAQSPSLQIRNDGTAGGLLFLWPFAILWNAFLVGFVINGYATFKLSDRLDFYFIFTWLSLAGMAFLTLALYTTAIAIRYGRSILQLQLPLHPGSILTGAIRIPRPFLFDEAIHVRLVCYRLMPGMTRNDISSINQTVIWEDTCELDRFAQGTPISTIPVFFKIPPDATPSDTSMTLPRVQWILLAKARTHGVNYASSFALPITPGPVPRHIDHLVDPTAGLRSPLSGRRQMADRHTHVTLLPAGGVQCELARGRNLTPSIILMTIGLLFTTIISRSLLNDWTAKNSAHGIDLAVNIFFIPFQILFGLLGLTMIVAAFVIFFGTTSIIAQHGRLIINRNLILFHRLREFRFADIRDITIAPDGAIGNRPLYSVNAVTDEAQPYKICGMLSDKKDAQWLADAFKNALQLPSPTTT